MVRPNRHGRLAADGTSATAKVGRSPGIVPGVDLLDPLRLVMVMQRFWPLVGGAETVLGHLAAELVGRGCRVTMLTAKWQPGWPAKILFHEAPVVRLPYPPNTDWNTFRYVRSVIRWLRNHREDYDLVYASGLGHDAYAAVRAAGRRVPVVLRAQRAGRHGDCLWQLEARCGRRIKQSCMRAAAFVGASRAVVRELQAAGFPRPRIHELPDGVPIPPPRSVSAKRNARTALSAAHATLSLPERTPLAVYTGRLHHNRQLKYLVAAWQTIVGRWPGARLWLAGEGSNRTVLLRQIEALNLTGRVVPVGVFQGTEELLAAADLFVSPSAEAGVPVSLLEAMAAGLPIAAADTPGNRSVITDRQHGLLVPVDDAEALSDAIFCLFDRPELAAQLGAAARRRAAEEFSLAKMVDRHVTLFQRLIHPEANLAGTVPAVRDDP